jgi:hypothetical protein
VTTYWDVITVNLANQTSLDLNLGNVDPLPHGEYGTWPVARISNGQTASPAFDAHSLNASEVGPGPGQLAYGLPDGTQLNIQWDMIFAVAQTSYVAAQVAGVSSGSYKVEITCSQDSWHGQGKRFNATITMSVDSAGPPSAQCSKS